ncbi:hypothetical protein ACFX2F_017224 [Malus domestica]
MKPTANVPEVDMERRLTTLLSHPWYLTSVDQNDICVEAWSMISKNNLGYDINRSMAFLHCSRICISHAIYKVGMTETDVHETLKNSFPEFMAILFETLWQEMGFKAHTYTSLTIVELQLKAPNLQSVHLEWGKGEVPNNLQAGKDGKSKGGVRATVKSIQ